MPTITTSLDRVCPSGGHVHLKVSIDGGAQVPVTFNADDLRRPMSEVTQEERDAFVAMALRLHFIGRTRNQMRTELTNGWSLVV